MIIVRISLILAMICGGVSIYIGHTKVQERIDTTTENLNRETANLATETRNREDEESRLQAAISQLDATYADYENTEKQVNDRQMEIDNLKTQIAGHNDERRKAEQDRAEIIRNNQEWFDLNTTVSKVKQIQQELPVVEDKLATTHQELDVVTRDNMRLRNMILRINPPNNPPALPEGLQGKITVYDPKYEYVVMNVGGNQGVLANGIISVQREGELLGKIRIMRVEDTYSVGNFLIEHKQGEIAEGDTVINLGK